LKKRTQNTTKTVKIVHQYHISSQADQLIHSVLHFYQRIWFLESLKMSINWRNHSN